MGTPAPSPARVLPSAPGSRAFENSSCHLRVKSAEANYNGPLEDTGLGALTLCRKKSVCNCPLSPNY